MTKIDLKRDLKPLYSASSQTFQQVKVPKLSYLMVDGQGDPNTSPKYLEAISLLYSTSYALKFFSKKELERDYTVPPLEGRWWAENMNSYLLGNKDDWLWTMMIMVPTWITKTQVKAAIAATQDKKPDLDYTKLNFESFTEGLSVQILHIGPYDEEAPTIARLHSEYLPSQGLVPTGKHHEIYLNDPRKTAPAKLKTILRQPVAKK